MEFIRTFTDVTIAECDTKLVCLECEISRASRDKVQWFKDDKPLDCLTNKQMIIEELENGTTHRLIIRPLVEENLGLYSIKIEELRCEARVDMKSEYGLYWILLINVMI